MYQIFLEKNHSIGETGSNQEYDVVDIITCLGIKLRAKNFALSYDGISHAPKIECNVDIKRCSDGKITGGYRYNQSPHNMPERIFNHIKRELKYSNYV